VYRTLLSVAVFGGLIFSSASAAEVDNLTPAVTKVVNIYVFKK